MVLYGLFYTEVFVLLQTEADCQLCHCSLLGCF